MELQKLEKIQVFFAFDFCPLLSLSNGRFLLLNIAFASAIKVVQPDTRFFFVNNFVHRRSNIRNGKHAQFLEN